MHTGWKELIMAGGPVLALLALLSIYSLGIIFERFAHYRKALANADEFIKEIKRLVRAGQKNKARETCEGDKTPAAKILTRALHAQGGPVEKREYILSAIDWQVTRLQQKLPILATIGSTTPFIGLFGTVLGVMKAFKDLSAYSGAGASVVAAGIAEALVNTAAGLFVAIPAIFAYNYFTSRTNRFSKEMEYASEEILNLMLQHDDAGNEPLPVSASGRIMRPAPPEPLPGGPEPRRAAPVAPTVRNAGL
ncbi:MAG: MotA/TolQ/ExbB proton channel family protein [Elusimicrobiaceae bacterium]|nr:MotA/TolQ/ExbB proton channel family protein [Elusimicrobiaceae bacterium]